MRSAECQQCKRVFDVEGSEAKLTKVLQEHECRLSNQEILTKALERAVDNGWYLPKPFTDGADAAERMRLFDDIGQMQDLAKALWGGEVVCDHCLDVDCGRGVYCGKDNRRLNPSWEVHLQQMVIADDPIKYLGENI